MQQTAFFSSIKWQVTRGNCRSRPDARERDGGETVGGAGTRSQALAAGCPGPLMCYPRWELKNSILRSHLLRQVGSCQPQAALFISALTKGFMPFAPEPQRASLSLKSSESKRWRWAWKAVTLQKSTSNKQLEHAGTWGWWAFMCVLKGYAAVEMVVIISRVPGAANQSHCRVSGDV